MEEVDTNLCFMEEEIRFGDIGVEASEYNKYLMSYMHKPRALIKVEQTTSNFVENVTK